MSTVTLSMGNINELSGELLVKILSYLPTKVAVSTSILSKQWEFLWMWLPKLEYSITHYSEFEWKRLQCFLHRNLPLHRAPVIESFCLQFRNPHLKPEDIKLWVITVVSHCLRNLRICYSSNPNEPDILPSNLYTCKSLVTLRLDGKILVDVPRMVCLPCLKTLRLDKLTYFNEDSLPRLLSNCTVLENLLVEGCVGDNMRKCIVTVPSLLRLLLFITNDLNEFVINTPSLKYLELEYLNSKSHYCLIENMPKLKDATIYVCFPYIKKLIGSITSVERPTLCLVHHSAEALYGDGFVFNKLVHLKLCICQEYASTVLVRFLKDSPNLQVLELFGMEVHGPNGILFWNQPSTVPKCLLLSLQTFKFSGYLGRPEERDLAIYILKNSPRLNTATILSEDHLFPTLDMLQALALSPRASSTCELVFE